MWDDLQNRPVSSGCGGLPLNRREQAKALIEKQFEPRGRSRRGSGGELCGGLVGGEFVVDEGEDAGGDLLDGSGLVEQGDAVGLAGGDGEVLVVDAAVEGVAFALEAVFVGAVLAGVAIVAAAGAIEGGFEGREEQQGEVGLDAVAGGAVHGEDAVGAEVAAGALVGLGGVGVAVAEDNVAAVEGGEDDLVEGLGAVGEHEGHLGGGGDLAELGFASGVEQDAADAVAEAGAAGLAEGDDAMAFGFERGGEPAELGGLAGAVQALEGDEESAAHGLSLLHLYCTGRRGLPRLANVHLME